VIVSTSFCEAMERCARSQGIPLPRVRAVVDLLGPGEEEFVNIFSADDRRELLILTSTRTCHVYRGPFRPKLRWAVGHVDLLGVRATRASGVRNFVIDSVLLETTTEILEFRFGFTDPSYVFEVQREIASHNAHVAAEDIHSLVHQSSRGAPGIGSGGTPNGFNYLSR
jgi:hypothetical protein